MIFKNISIIDKDFNLVRNQNVVVSGDRFAYIGADETDTAGHEIVDGSRKLIMPAFYNTHCHAGISFSSISLI